MSINEATVEQFIGQVITDIAAVPAAALVRIGHRLGLYRGMVGAGPVTAAQLAKRTGTHVRYVREWLNNQAAGGYVVYLPEEDAYELPDEHAMVLAEEDSPVFMAGGLDGLAALWAASDKIEEAFQTGRGVGWHEHDPLLFSGTEEFFRPAYRAHLTSEWIPALDGVEGKLRAGARVADVGCGHGASTIVMAEAFPRSRFVGFDYHEESVTIARNRASQAGVSDRVTFERASATEYPAAGYDLVCFFDCLHDMGDPIGAAAHARRALADDGTVMLIEPYAGDRVEDNLTPFGRAFYGFSTFFCTPNSLSQEVGLALGGQAGEARLREVFEEAGFRHFRRVTETPANLILEARP